MSGEPIAAPRGPVAARGRWWLVMLIVRQPKVPRADPLPVRPDSPQILHFPSEEFRVHPSSRCILDAMNVIDGGDRSRSDGVCSRFAKKLRVVKQAFSQ